MRTEFAALGNWDMAMIVGRAQHVFMVAISEQIPSLVFGIATVMFLGMGQSLKSTSLPSKQKTFAPGPRER